MFLKKVVNYIKSIHYDKGVIHYDSLDSTNEEAKRLIQTGSIERSAIIIADTQTSGKTTKINKIWNSPIGNLYTSYIYKIDNVNYLTKISSLVSVAILRTIQYFSVSCDLKTVDIKIKWPNDILINEKKLSGILIEVEKFKKDTFVIIGTGVNILKAPKINDGRSATSLIDEGFYLNVHKFAKIYNNILKRMLNKLDDQSFLEIRKTILQYSYKIGENIKIMTSDGKKLSGKFAHIDKRGALILETKKGDMVQVMSGSII